MTNVIKAGTAACQECGHVDELRPYGRGGAWICFACGMKDEEETKRQFRALLEGGLVIDATEQNGEPWERP
jgi:hypothetical protein